MEKGLNKNGKMDKRKTKILLLSFKGLAFLILKADLSENECRAIVLGILNKSPYRKVSISQSMREIPTLAFKKTFEQMRPRVNLDFFDEEYFANLFFETLILDNVLTGIKKWKEQHFDKLSQNEQQQYATKEAKDAKKLSPEIPQMLFTIYDNLRSKKESLNEKIQLLKPIVQFYEKMGFKPKENKPQFSDEEWKEILETIQKSEEVAQEIKDFFQNKGETKYE